MPDVCPFLPRKRLCQGLQGRSDGSQPGPRLQGNLRPLPCGGGGVVQRWPHHHTPNTDRRARRWKYRQASWEEALDLIGKNSRSFASMGSRKKSLIIGTALFLCVSIIYQASPSTKAKNNTVPKIPGTQPLVLDKPKWITFADVIHNRRILSKMAPKAIGVFLSNNLFLQNFYSFFGNILLTLSKVESYIKTNNQHRTPNSEFRKSELNDWIYASCRLKIESPSPLLLVGPN